MSVELNNNSRPQQEHRVPDPVEVVTVANSLMGVTPGPGGVAILFFQTIAGRRYCFPLDLDARHTLSRKLLAPSVQTAAPGQMP